MHAAMHVRMRVGFIALDRAHHRQGLLGGGGAVEVDERPAIDRARENGEVAAHAFGIERLFGERLDGCDVHRSSFKSAATSIRPASARSMLRLRSGMSIFAT